jgi:DNA-binding transcriptional regulator YdaS (Cro superfamily)
MIFTQQNFVRTAVDRLGGPTKSANAIGVSNTTIHAWINQGRISNIDKARLMEELSGMDLQQLRGTW